MPTTMAQPQPAAVSPSDDHQPNLSPLDSPQIVERYTILQRAFSLPGRTQKKMDVLFHVLESGFHIDAFSDPQLVQAVGCCEKTVESARKWIIEHNLFIDIGLNSQIDTPHKNFTLCMSSSFCTESSLEVQDNIHGEIPFSIDSEPSLAPAVSLALEKLLLLGFNAFPQEEGKEPVLMPRRRERTLHWIHRYGVENVLYALWKAESPRKSVPIRTKPGFVRVTVEGGQEAPAGWIHPELREREKAQEAPPVSPTPVPEPIAPIPDLKTPEAWTAIHDALEARMRPQSFNVWFKPTHFLPGEEDGTVEVWVTSGTALKFIQVRYRDMLQEALTSTELFDRTPRIKFRVIGSFQGN